MKEPVSGTGERGARYARKLLSQTETLQIRPIAGHDRSCAAMPTVAVSYCHRFRNVAIGQTSVNC